MRPLRTTPVVCTETKKTRRRIVDAAFFLLAALLVHPAKANITVEEYALLRKLAADGDEGASNRWRAYVVGLMDGIQAVQAPTGAAGGRLFFCMDDKFPMSPQFLAKFLDDALKRIREAGQYEKRKAQPMAVLVALELKRAFPCQ